MALFGERKLWRNQLWHCLEKGKYGVTSYGSGCRKEICSVASYGSGWRKETYGVTSYETYGVTNYDSVWRKET